MIKGRENLFAWMELNKAPYWTLYLRGAGEASDKKFMEADHSVENLSMHESTERLKKALAVMSPGIYSIVAKEGKDDKRAGVFRDTFEYTQEYGYSSGAPMISGIPKEDVAAQIEKALNDYKREQEIKELKARLEAAERQPAWISGMKPIAEAIAMKIYATYMSGGAPSVGVSGFPKGSPRPQPQSQTTETETMEETQENSKRLQAALEQMDAVLEPAGHDILAVIEKLAAMAKNEPQKLVMYVNMLM